MAGLFRDQVIAHRSATLFEGVVIRTGRHSAVLSAAALSLALAVVIVACVGTYARKERVLGTLAPASGMAMITAPRTGIVSAIAVSDGQRVEADQVLFTLASAADTGESNADAAQLDSLLAERTALSARTDAEHRLAEAHAADLARQLEHVRDQAGLLERQAVAAERRAELVTADLARLEVLAARGHVAANLLDVRLGEQLEHQQRLYAVRAERDRLRHEAASLESELASLPERRAVAVAERHARALALDRAIAAADAQWAVTVRAPFAGSVDTLRLRFGEQLAAGAVALTLVPDDVPLRAELLVAAGAAGFVTPGQRVRVRYDAYPYQKFGLHDAVIHSIGRSALAPDEQPPGLRLPVPAYRIIAELGSQTVRTPDGDLSLRPGQTLQADLIRDRRTVVEWLFEPLLAVARAR